MVALVTPRVIDLLFHLAEEGTPDLTGEQPTILEVLADDELFGWCFQGSSWPPSHLNGWDALCVAKPSGAPWRLSFVVTLPVLAET